MHAKITYSSKKEEEVFGEVGYFYEGWTGTLAELLDICCWTEQLDWAWDFIQKSDLDDPDYNFARLLRCEGRDQEWDLPKAECYGDWSHSELI